MRIPGSKLFSLVEHYFVWHYSQAYYDIYHVWKNFLFFCFNFFSINELLHSLFQPWKRMGEDYPKSFDLPKMAQTFIVNTLMRFVGAMMRLLVVGFGLLFSSIIFLIGLLILLVWTVMPVFFISLIVMGISLIMYG